jgi:hypothetical protein
MPAGTFRVRIAITNAKYLAALRDKLADFGEAFQAVIDRWADHNEAKFLAAQGKQAVGVSFDAGEAAVFWKPLSESYLAWKTAQGVEDWLMVLEGDLIESMTNADDTNAFQEVTPMAARFGTLLPQATFNADTRPVMFLDATDREMIRDMFTAYMGSQPPFRPWKPSAAKKMDAEYHAVMSAMGF